MVIVFCYINSRSRNVFFKELTSRQVVLFPGSIDERIPAGHLVGLVNKLADQRNINGLLSTYKGSGTRKNCSTCNGSTTPCR